jgi:uncharacterized protein (TIGR02266 family)
MQSSRQPQDAWQEVDRACDLISSASSALAMDGIMDFAEVDRLAVAGDGLRRFRDATHLSRAHRALAAVLRTARWRARRDIVDALALAQRILHPIARTSGVEARHDERRNHLRAELEAEVSLESETNFFMGFSEDISEGGLFVATYDLLPVGSQIQIELALPDGYVVRAIAEVRWVRDLRDESDGVSPGLGLRFVELQPTDRDAITQFVQARAPIFYDE